MKENLRGLFFKAVLFSYILFSPASFVLADGETCLPGRICNPLASKGINDIPGFVKTLLEGALKIGIPLIALAIIYCGFLFVAARGNSEKINKAKTAFLYTVIGAAILLGSLAITTLISNTVKAL